MSHLIVSTAAARRLLLRLVLFVAVVLVALVATAVPAEGSSKLCGASAAGKYAASLAAKIKVPAPSVVEDASSRHGAYFTPGTSTISIKPGCTTKTTVAHEFGHYVVDLAAGMNWDEHQGIARHFTGYRNWLKTSSDSEGFERAAHCVGYQFVKNGTYTKCPYRAARDAAKFVIATASARYPAP
jgi:hypothetical protein